MEIIQKFLLRLIAQSLIGLCVISLWACSSETVFKDNADLPDGKWYIKNVPSFTFEIEDASLTYNLYYNVRNNISYPYYNLYLSRYLYNSQGKVINSKLDELILADASTGKPFGSGLGDICDHKVLAISKYKFPAKGKYTFKIAQYMRQNPLPDVLSVGVSIERATE